MTQEYVMSENVKTVKQVCKCENCGNEAEMMVTCTLHEEEAEAPQRDAAPAKDASGHKIKGTATCSHCGNEADMWVDL